MSGPDIWQAFGDIEMNEGFGHLMFCIDRDRTHEAMFHVWPDRNRGGNFKPFAVLAQSPAEGTFQFTPKNYFLESAAGLYLPNLSAVEMSKLQEITATLKPAKSGAEGEWSEKDGKAKRLTLSSLFVEPARVQAEKCESWDDFKKWATRSRGERGAIVFRGHGSSNFALCTTLYRAGRARLERYCSTEFREFSHHAEAVLGVRLNLNDRDDYATVMGLAQHHGLPTPMLDWTASPYIAAFFAFSDALEFQSLRADTTHVRIFALSREFVEQTSPHSFAVSAVAPYVASLVIGPRLNPRLYAQQGRFLVTNVGNLEAFIQTAEGDRAGRYLMAIDVPIQCAVGALDDLRFMGLTAATLFPGLDGVGRMIRHRMASGTGVT